MRRLRLISPVLNALPAFEAAAQTNSFTAAAKRLGMAQPSVSRFISNLEHHIGHPLFSRKNNRITLTAEGQKLYMATQLGLGHIRSVIEEFNEMEEEKVITIGCTHGFAHMWLLPRIEGLKSRLTDTEIRVVTADHLAIYSTEEVDIAIRFGEGSWPGEEAHLLFGEKVFPVCSSEFADCHKLSGRPLSAEEFSDLPLLFQDTGEHGWLGWQQFLARFNMDYKPVKQAYAIYNYAFILQAAMEGKGIALAWDNLAEPYLSNKWLVQLQGLEVETGRGYYLVLSKKNAVADIVRDWVKEIDAENNVPAL